MAWQDQLKSVFKKKPPAEQADSSMSVSLPDASMFQMEADLKSGETQYGPPDLLPRPAPAATAAAPAAAASPKAALDQVALPFLGKRAVAQHQRVLSVLLMLALAVLALLTVVGVRQTGQAARQVGAVAQAQMQSQRLAKLVTQALVGNTRALTDVAQSAQVLAKSVHGLLSGDTDMGLSPVDGDDRMLLDRVEPLTDRTEKNATVVLGQKKALEQIGSAVPAILRQSVALSDAAQALATLKTQQPPRPPRSPPPANWRCWRNAWRGRAPNF